MLFGWKDEERSGLRRRIFISDSESPRSKKYTWNRALVSSLHNVSLLAAPKVSLLSCRHPQSLWFQLPPSAGGGQSSLSMLCFLPKHRPLLSPLSSSSREGQTRRLPSRRPRPGLSGWGGWDAHPVARVAGAALQAHAQGLWLRMPYSSFISDSKSWRNLTIVSICFFRTLEEKETNQFRW
jgi:hypothetical protein